MRCVLVFVSYMLLLSNASGTETNRFDLPRSRPEEVGMSSERLDRIRQKMQTYVDAKQLPGVITMVARRGKLVHFEQVGQMDVEAATPMQADTIFRMYSMSKPVTGVAIMILYEEGRFLLTDPVSDYLPEFKDMKVYLGGSYDNPRT